ncbi:MAG TPA: histidine phosphatase family protein [Dermatophilaceae bacterium]|nr:histidine phosphatase family protein [Dermatophilaceae bacterium]
MSRRWPAELVIVRHGQSVGNLADQTAQRRGAHRLELPARDADVELSPTGQRQAEAVGRVLGDRRPPDVVLSSPYRRAAATAAHALRAMGATPDLILDERLRERDLGLFDGLTPAGIRSEYPDEAKRRSHVGKFYYQPPSGESWCDVSLRVRSLLADLREGYAGARVWLFSHQAVIMTFRYVLEDLSEEQLLEIQRDTQLPNCSVTSYRAAAEGMELVAFADATAVEQVAEVTVEQPQAGRGDDLG